MTEQYHSDVLIIGSGAAGLSLAARLDSHLSIAILSKGDIRDSCTFHAQGGVAAVLDGDKTQLDAHIQDTLTCGGGLCDINTIEFTVNHARASIEWLIAQGIQFDRIKQGNGAGPFHLAKEGGHSQRRILHAADATGQAVSRTLIELVRSRSNIHLFTEHNAIDLIIANRHDGEKKRCIGAYVFNRKRMHVGIFSARCVVLACGGASKVYLYSTNPDVSSGDGIAMAYRAGCRIGNMEFNQFHPTCLYHAKAPTFLISEALRGEGARLKRPDGSTFMQHYDARGELASRDVVARAIDHEMKRSGLACVYLDITHRSAAFIQKHFPTISEHCRNLAIDISKQPIPVVPAAHYTCGGIVTDNTGQTDITGLYAIGEVALTGLHGANRMASNSLLECLVFAASASHSINKNIKNWPSESIARHWDESQVIDSDEAVVVTHNWNELRHFMWDYVGIVRSTKRLERAKNRINLLQQEIQEYYTAFKVSHDLLELRNLVLVADLMVQCALMRQESRGLHYNIDYPDIQDASTSSRNTIITPPHYLPNMHK